jgi:GNAT superfamily N-acetyltransferase
MIRPGTDADAAAYIRLIGDAWREYPGVVFDVDAELPELRALATWFAQQNGVLWLAEENGRALGMIATRPLGADDAYEICRLYLDRSARGSGLAQRLLDMAEARARGAGAARMVLWTDTRFEAAHAFYEKRGYVRQGAIRILDDLSRSLEFRYTKPAQGLVVEAMDAAAATSAERPLSRILAECVAEGASLSYLPPLAPDIARAYWRGVSAEVAQGQRLLLLAWHEGQLAGSVQLALQVQQNQPHRVEVEKLMVAPSHRRQGVGTALVQRAEQAAARLGRRVLTLDTRAGAAGEALFRRLGWQEAGRIPRLELDLAHVAQDVLFFFKEVAP